MTGSPPSRQQCETAYEAARRMREREVDPHHLAATLLYLRQRCQRLDELLELSDRYLRFGLPEHELSEMRLLVEALREAEPADADARPGGDTLPI